MADQIYEGTIGTVINILFDEDILGATALKFYCKKATGVEVVWTPTIVGVRTLSYITVEGDLVCGKMTIQPSFTLGSWSGLCTPVSIRVYRKFE